MNGIFSESNIGPDVCIINPPTIEERAIPKIDEVKAYVAISVSYTHLTLPTNREV